MQIYKVTFPGLWLGGVAIVKAESAEKAKQLVVDHPKFINQPTSSGKPPEKEMTVSVKAFETDPVIYIDNGDY